MAGEHISNVVIHSEEYNTDNLIESISGAVIHSEPTAIEVTLDHIQEVVVSSEAVEGRNFATFL